MRVNQLEINIFKLGNIKRIRMEKEKKVLVSRDRGIENQHVIGLFLPMHYACSPVPAHSSI